MVDVTTMENATRELGVELARLIHERCGNGVGFALLVFDFGDSGWLTYASNADRTSLISLVEEWLGKVKRSS